MKTTAYKRRFKTETSSDQFIITELEPLQSQAAVWTDWAALSREAAWQQARAQHLPVIVNLLNGGVKNLGVVFNADVFERAAYMGYVSAGLAMSDGFYAPLSFASWANDFRRSPDQNLNEPEQRYLVPSLPAYLRAKTLGG